MLPDAPTETDANPANDRPTEAIAVLSGLLQAYPDTPLYRQALIQQADLLFEQRQYRQALASYQRFVEKYPSGNDSIQALYRTARCREELGDLTPAVTTLRLRLPRTDARATASVRTAAR